MNIREVGVCNGIRLKETHVAHVPGEWNVADIFTKEHKSSVTFRHLAGLLIHPRLDATHSEALDDSDKENQALGGCLNVQLTSRTKGRRIQGGAEGYQLGNRLAPPNPLGRSTAQHGSGYIRSR